MRRFDVLAGIFGALLVLPALGFLGEVAFREDVSLASGEVCPQRCVRAEDLAWSGILVVGATVVFSALASGSVVALRAASSGAVSVAALLVALAPTAGRAWPQDVALAAFLLAGAGTLALAAHERPQRTSTPAAHG